MSDAQIGARLLDACDGIAQIVVLDQRDADQFLELFVIEDLEPFQVGERGGLRLRERHGRAEIRGHGDLGPFVVGSNGAPGQHCRGCGDCEVCAIAYQSPCAGEGAMPVSGAFAPESFSTT